VDARGLSRHLPVKVPDHPAASSGQSWVVAATLKRGGLARGSFLAQPGIPDVLGRHAHVAWRMRAVNAHTFALLTAPLPRGETSKGLCGRSASLRVSR
jgi:hypothetical protein